MLLLLFFVPNEWSSPVNTAGGATQLKNQGQMSHYSSRRVQLCALLAVGQIPKGKVKHYMDTFFIYPSLYMQ